MSAFFAYSAYGTALNGYVCVESTVPFTEVTKVMSAWFHCTAFQLPFWLLPAPIRKEIKPLALLVTVCVSLYFTAGSPLFLILTATVTWVSYNR